MSDALECLGTLPARPPLCACSGLSGHMDNNVARRKAIQRDRDRAEAELAVMKQEHLLQNLVTTREPTAEPVEQLARLCDILKRLAASADGASDA